MLPQENPEHDCTILQWREIWKEVSAASPLFKTGLQNKKTFSANMTQSTVRVDSLTRKWLIISSQGLGLWWGSRDFRGRVQLNTVDFPALNL